MEITLDDFHKLQSKIEENMLDPSLTEGEREMLNYINNNRNSIYTIEGHDKFEFVSNINHVYRITADNSKQDYREIIKYDNKLRRLILETNTFEPYACSYTFMKMEDFMKYKPDNKDYEDYLQWLSALDTLNRYMNFSPSIPMSVDIA